MFIGAQHTWWAMVLSDPEMVDGGFSRLSTSRPVPTVDDQSKKLQFSTRGVIIWFSLLIPLGEPPLKTRGPALRIFPSNVCEKKTFVASKWLYAPHDVVNPGSTDRIFVDSIRSVDYTTECLSFHVYFVFFSL